MKVPTSQKSAPADRYPIVTPRALTTSRTTPPPLKTNPPLLPVQIILLENEWLLPIGRTVNPMEPSHDMAVLPRAFRIKRGRTLSVRGRPGESSDGNTGRTYSSAAAGGQIDIQGSICVALQVWGVIDSWCGWCRGSLRKVVTPPLLRPMKTLALHLAGKDGLEKRNVSLRVLRQS